MREGSEGKLPPGCETVVGNALDEATFAPRVAPADTFLQLVGVAHPSPARAAEFRSVDLASVRASAKAAAGVSHFVYVSVAQPAPVMKAYVEARAEGGVGHPRGRLERHVLAPLVRAGAGPPWPYLILPVYRLLQLFPPMRDTARRLYPVTLEQMVAAMVTAVEEPAAGIRIVETQQILRARRSR